MADWDRRTPWRQGHVLTAETVAALGLVSDQDPVDPLVVVVSHDCDLAQDPTVEPAVEVIIGCRVDKADPEFDAKCNTRRHQTGSISLLAEPSLSLGNREGGFGNLTHFLLSTKCQDQILRRVFTCLYRVHVTSESGTCELAKFLMRCPVSSGDEFRT